MPERSHQGAFQTWPTVHVCGLPVSAVGIEDSANSLIAFCRSLERARRSEPLLVTSVTGQVLSMCARSRRVFDLFRGADIIHRDGQPLVLLSRRLGPRIFPERLATTDLFPAMARLAETAGTRFGYLSEAEETAAAEHIARLKPDVLWVALGAPREQEFFFRHGEALREVGIIKTSGGLIDFLAWARARAPRWLQSAGLEWLFRLLLEPRRLFWRSLVTNPHALDVMMRTMR